MFDKAGRTLSRFVMRVLSVSIFIKIMGIGALVAVVFGGIIFFQSRYTLSRNLYQLLAQMTLSRVDALASSIERPMTTGDLVSIDQILTKTMARFPDARYIIVRNSKGEILAHTFQESIPVDLLDPPLFKMYPVKKLRILDASPEGKIFEAARPIVKGHAGMVQLGVSDQMVSKEVESLTNSIIEALLLSGLIGIGLAIVLTYILTQPVHHLKNAAQSIKEGDFEVVAPLFFEDEIGKLAISFNEMAGSIRRYRDEVEEKEKARRMLIERIVVSQEEERKTISRELHDQFGQSLLAIKMAIQSHRKYDRLPKPVREELEKEIGELTDDLNRIVRGMRPTILDDYGLDSALANYVNEMSQHFDLDITYKYIGASQQARLPGSIEVTLFRIAQEAISNIIRHAQADDASVVVFQSPQEVSLLVEDNGVGFESGSINTNKGLGLLGIRERISLVRGTLDIESVVGDGTTIRVRIPMEKT